MRADFCSASSWGPLEASQGWRPVNSLVVLLGTTTSCSLMGRTAECTMCVPTGSQGYLALAVAPSRTNYAPRKLMLRYALSRFANLPPLPARFDAMCRIASKQTAPERLAHAVFVLPLPPTGLPGRSQLLASILEMALLPTTSLLIAAVYLCSSTRHKVCPHPSE